MVIEDYYTHHMIAASLLRSHLRDLVIYVLLTYLVLIQCDAMVFKYAED